MVRIWKVSRRMQPSYYWYWCSISRTIADASNSRDHALPVILAVGKGVGRSRWNNCILLVRLSVLWAV
ncbi:hypothetical protein KCP76_17195 [Salmonella enterica subsp. enterica serovar Weltevreden]|nr:hypothetical protein KCP76_17195 [Salmonella enterica subsp. enterica serovar Weltevreden]